nr:EF-hand domain-containing family member C2-like [Cherax quadricarinatus]XP_053627068.1 EF-hand domain-containing family member C2-like [Cherax quadricarinatus]
MLRSGQCLQLSTNILSFGGLVVEEAAGDRKRNVMIYFHLEDDTLRLVELPTPNAGAVQGTLVGRQRVATSTHPLAPHLTLHHFKVGEYVTVLGRRYLVTSCDRATRTYLTSLGLAPQPDLAPHPTTVTQVGPQTCVLAA